MQVSFEITLYSRHKSLVFQFRVSYESRGGCQAIMLKKLAFFVGLCTLSGLVYPDEGMMRVRTVNQVVNLLNILSGVAPPLVPALLTKVGAGQVKLGANNPVWVLDGKSGLILFYQGEPGFVGQPASRLVDESGVRFGVRAMEALAQSRARWMLLRLGAVDYMAYCAARDPYIVCSVLVP